jgi:hypothetical protein
VDTLQDYIIKDMECESRSQYEELNTMGIKELKDERQGQEFE